LFIGASFVGEQIAQRLLFRKRRGIASAPRGENRKAVEG
jgi:hypothetical protein